MQCGDSESVEVAPGRGRRGKKGGRNPSMIYTRGGTGGCPGCVFSRTIKLMLERQKSSIYQHEMLLECAKITPYQQDMSY